MKHYVLSALGKLKAFYRERGRMPSYAELADMLGYKSKWGAQLLIEKWIQAGAIRRDAQGKLIPGNCFGTVKLLGSVAAGWPSPAEEENVDAISLDDWIIKNKEGTYMLQVRGDSMIDAGICNGDFVVIDRGRLPVHGGIVVAEVDSEWTVKYFHQQGGRTLLVPANKNFSAIEPREELRIAGVVTAVIRKYF